MLQNNRSEIDRYRIHESVGQGSFGVIYRATKIEDGQEVAIKIIDTCLLTKEQDKQQIEAELTAFSAFKDLPFVIKALNRFTYQNYQAIVMEFAPLDLNEIIQTYTKLPYEFVIYILAELVQGLESIHYRGYSHRDIKPANILIDRCGNVRITDFGTVKKLDEDECLMVHGEKDFFIASRQGSRTISRMDIHAQVVPRQEAASFVGTQIYEAPEVRNMKVIFTSATDIFSLGLIAYQLCGGQLMSTQNVGINYIQIVRQYLYTLPANYNELKQFIIHCLEKDPVKRFEGGWPRIKELDVFSDIKFEELEGYNKINALELKKDSIQYKRTKVKINRPFQIKTKELIEKAASYQKYLLKQELANYVLECKIDFEGSIYSSVLLITDFHRILLIRKTGLVYFEEFVVIQDFEYELQQETQLLVTLRQKQFTIIAENHEQLLEFIRYIETYFKPFNRQYCIKCAQYTVKDMICVKCGHPAKNQTKFVYFQPTSCYVPKTESITQTLKNEITERTQIDANRIINLTQSLKINFPKTKEMLYGEMCQLLEQINDLKTKIYFPSEAELDGLVEAYPLPRILCLFSNDDQTQISSETAVFFRTLRFSVCKYGYIMGFDYQGDETREKPPVDEDELMVDRRDNKADLSEFW